MCVLQSAWWRFCCEAHGVCSIKEDGARIGQPGCETVHCFLGNCRSVDNIASGSSGATTLEPNGETLAGCVARAQKSKPSHTRAQNWKTKLSNCISFLRRNCVQQFILQMQQCILFFFSDNGCLRTQSYATVKSLTIACLWGLANFFAQPFARTRKN